MTEPRTETPVDLRFDLPNVDDPADTEVGIILLALDADRLLAGLGMASLADDPGRIAVTVDRLRHSSEGAVDSLETAATAPRHTVNFLNLISAGAGYWRAIRPAVATAYPEAGFSASIRQSWTRAFRALDTPALGPIGLATRVYLTACWLRRADVDPLAGA